MKQATVFLRGIKAGILTEDENGYTFFYGEWESCELEWVNLVGANCILPVFIGKIFLC